MSLRQTDTLRDLLRRIDEVRGLADGHHARTELEPGDTGALLDTLGELVEELERSHRRLIETNVQLVSLREVASSVVSATDAGETTRTVTDYLCRAFGLPHVFLLLANRESGRLEGTWAAETDGRRHSLAVEVPMAGDRGAIARALWLDRTVTHHSPRQHPPAFLPDGHPLQDVLDGLGSVVCVPLQRTHPTVPAGDTHELCGARCILGDPALLAPPPGPGAESWALEREERQRHCLACEFMPMLGVLGAARPAAAPPFSAGDVTLLESVGLSVAPMVENARLTQDLRRSERFRDHVLDSMASALVAVNMQGGILTFNRAAEALLGWPEREVLGMPFGQLCGMDGEAVIHATLEHGREATREETLLRARDGAPVPVSLTTSLLRDEKRAVYGAIATFMDLTPLKRAEEHARRLDRLAALGRFTSSVAHEIRNPLTGIAAGIQYLARSLGPEGRGDENLAFIQGEIKRLDRIVQDLFDITHPRGLQLRSAPLDQAVRHALQCLDALFAERDLRLEVELSPRTPPVPHDADQLEQVLINLLKNAAEASPPGAPLRVGVGPAAQPSRRQRAAPAAAGPGAVIRIEDRGCGISPEHQKTIFEPFFTTKPGGTGLGLYISHDIVKRHGGRLTLNSEPGRGTTFTVELPLENHGGES